MSASVRVFVCDDHPIVRSGLVALLSSGEGIEVVGQAGDGLTAIELCRQLLPDVVLMDLSLPMLNGLDATRRLRQCCPGTHVLILSMHDDGESLRRCRAAGCSGYLVKGVDLDVLLQAVHRVARGEELFGPTAPGCARTDPRLTPREREVLQLIAEGYTNRETGVLLEISPKTVEKHRASLMEKLDAHDTASLTRHAVALGLVQAGGAGRG